MLHHAKSSHTLGSVGQGCTFVCPLMTRYWDNSKNIWSQWSSSTPFSSCVPSVTQPWAFCCSDRTLVADFTDFVPGETSHAKPILLSRSYAWCEGDDWCKVLVYICNEILVRIQPNIINRRLTTLSDASMLDVLPAWRSRKNFLCFCTQIPRLLSCLRVTTHWPCFSLNSMSWSYWEDGDKESQMGEGHTHDTHKNTC